MIFLTEEETIEETVETGRVQVSVKEAVTYHKIKNARFQLIVNGNVIYDDTSAYDGSILFDEVEYGSYNVKVTRTGYEDYTNTLNLNSASVMLPIFMTPLPKDPNVTEVDLDETYTFTITERVQPEYSMSSQISNWLQSNLAALKDDSNHSIFGKVNLGFSDESLRTFGKKPVCDVYIDNIDYSIDFDRQEPVKVNTMVLYYFKGANSPVYTKACQLHDLIMQEFLTNEEWKRSNIVRGTRIVNSEIRIQPLGKKWGVIGAFQLSHDLY